MLKNSSKPIKASITIDGATSTTHTLESATEYKEHVLECKGARWETGIPTTGTVTYYIDGKEIPLELEKKNNKFLGSTFIPVKDVGNVHLYSCITLKRSKYSPDDVFNYTISAEKVISKDGLKG